jgi:hypothetical protein
MMNERILELMVKAGFDVEKLRMYPGGFPREDLLILQDFAELIIKECNQAVLEVPLYYKDYRSQIEEAVIHDCARAVLEKFGVK